MKPTLEDLTDHICTRVAQTELTAHPFPHLVVDDALPPDLFSRLIADLPPAHTLIPVDTMGWSSVARYKQHGTALLSDLAGCADPDVWQAIERILSGPQVERSLREAFVTHVPETQAQSRLRKEIRLDCAGAGGHLWPHTDAPILFMKTLIYLSSATVNPSLDTLLYQPKDPAARIATLGAGGDYTDESYRHEDPDEHRVAGRVAFQPNRLLTFPRGRDTLHGLAPLAPTAAPRFLISIHYKHIRS